MRIKMFFRNLFGGFNMKTVTIENINGRSVLKANGQVVATYARERDARRGAKRRGLTVA